MSKPILTPTKKDLMLCLESLARHESAAVRKLHEEMLRTDAAADAFLDACKPYQKLIKAKQKADSKYYRTQRKDSEEKEAKIRKVRHAVWTRGVTPATIKLVEDLAKEIEKEIK